MSQKRRDNKNRILNTGEFQRKDGRYCYKYYIAKKAYYVYSTRLTKSDPHTRGKNDYDEPCLRELEDQVNQKRYMQISPNGGGMTVVELCEKYLYVSTGFTENTKANHRTTMKLLAAHPFGQMRIDQVNVAIAKLFLVSLQKEQKRSYSSIHSIRGVLRPAFRLAYESDLIKRNPFDFELKNVLINDSVTRDAISRDQERKFLGFIKDDKHFCQYYDAIYILFKTGMRISEFCGLTLKDIDFKKKTINIDHQLQRKADGTLYVYDKEVLRARTKTPAGTRCVPMLSDGVYEAFVHLSETRPKVSVEPSVDGYKGFLILNLNVRKEIRPMVAMDWEHIFRRIVEKYNSIYKVQIPSITPHICRHTFCNNMANSGMSPVHLQFLMGHSDIAVTMKHYVHTKTEDTREEIQQLQKAGKLKVEA